MSLTRRLAAGLPAAGATIFAALALSGAPASAATEDLSTQAQPAAMATPCVGNARECPKGYGSDASSPAATATTATATGTSPDDHRGNPGYGGTSPTTVPTTSPTTAPTTAPTPTGSTPTGYTDTVPPTGVSPTTVSPSTPGGGGVSPAGTLPLTGGPAVATAGLGAVLVGAGVFAVWYSRRRHSA